MFTEDHLLSMSFAYTAAVFNLISSYDKPGSATEKDLSPTAIFPLSLEGTMTTRRAADSPTTLAIAAKTFVSCREGKKRDYGKEI